MQLLGEVVNSIGSDVDAVDRPGVVDEDDMDVEITSRR